MCATLCSFCKKSAAKLVPHYLCDCCLVHLECCEATAENRLASLAKAIIPDEEDAFEKVDCEICLEPYSEDDLEEHQEMCMARVVFRCSVCDGDYVNKEGLWNHLDQHEIADESKELHYQEMRATYKLYKCVLCNDQRGYQESVYWRHVHEDHDGFFLRCLDCGENFRSEKRKTDHALSHCNARKQSETSDSTALELDEEIGIIFLPELESLPKKHGNHRKSLVPDVSKKNCELESLIRPEKSDFHKNNDDLTNGNSQFSKDPSEGNCDISQPNLKKPSIVTTDKKCSHCDKEFNDETMLARHIEYYHQPFKCDICGMTANNRNQIRYHKLMIHTKASYKCSHCSMVFHFNSAFQRHLAKHEKVKTVSCALCGHKFKSKFGLSWHMRRFHKSPSQATTKLGTAFNQQQQNKDPTDGTGDVNLKHTDDIGDNRCTYCAKQCHDKTELSRHYIYCHKPTECNICKQTLNGTHACRYHKLISHTEPRHKCPHCQQSFHKKYSYRRHLSAHIRKGMPCNLCDLKFKSIAHVKAHKKRAHSAKKVDQKEIPCERSSPITGCPLCGDNFEDEHLLSQHVGTTHQMTVCTCCGMTFVSTRLLRNHKQKYHSIAKYNCNQCNQTFNTRKVFYKHMAAHDKVSKLHCTICTLQFEDSPALRSHMALDHNIEPKRFVPECTCSVCGVTVDGRLRLAYHMLKCHTEPKFQCSHCPRKFVTEGNYLNHLQSHKSLRKFPCKFCSLKYKRKHHLKAHIESRHGSDQPVHVLRVHQDKSSQSKTKSDEGSVVACEEIDIKHEIPITLASSSATECSQCNQTFSDANELQDHLRVSHRSIECLICGLTFANAARLRNHTLRKYIV